MTGVFELTIVTLAALWLVRAVLRWLARGVMGALRLAWLIVRAVWVIAAGSFAMAAKRRHQAPDNDNVVYLNQYRRR